jgi:hypothetical protein
MKFEVYCDESRPDLLSSQHPPVRYLVIGSLWLRSDDRQEFKDIIHGLRDKHKIGGEFKWQKVSPSRLDFYRELVEWFMSMGSERLRFRCIAVEHEKVNLVKFHGSDQELGFYKFYYQMLHHWILDFNEYSIFCDFKQNRLRNRLHRLQRCLDCSNLSANVVNVQAIRSDESVLIQLADVLTGAAAARLNDSLRQGSAKEKVVEQLELAIHHTIRPTIKNEQKYNVFKINLQGGW